MQGIYVEKLIKYMDEMEKLNDGNLASCWVGLRLTLDTIQEEAAQQSVQRTAEKRCWCGLLIKDDGVCVNGHPQPPAANASR